MLKSPKVVSNETDKSDETLDWQYVELVHPSEAGLHRMQKHLFTQREASIYGQLWWRGPQFLGLLLVTRVEGEGLQPVTSHPLLVRDVRMFRKVYTGQNPLFVAGYETWHRMKLEMRHAYSLEVASQMVGGPSELDDILKFCELQAFQAPANAENPFVISTRQLRLEAVDLANLHREMTRIYALIHAFNLMFNVLHLHGGSLLEHQFFRLESPYARKIIQLPEIRSEARARVYGFPGILLVVLQVMTQHEWLLQRIHQHRGLMPKVLDDFWMELRWVQKLEKPHLKDLFITHFWQLISCKPSKYKGDMAKIAKAFRIKFAGIWRVCLKIRTELEEKGSAATRSGVHFWQGKKSLSPFWEYIHQYAKDLVKQVALWQDPAGLMKVCLGGLEIHMRPGAILQMLPDSPLLTRVTHEIGAD